MDPQTYNSGNEWYLQVTHSICASVWPLKLEIPESHTSVWPLELGIRTPMFRCAP